MNREELNKILENHKLWLKSEGGARANLFGANLCKADLFGANLRGANLRGANLSGVDLREANLFGANLCKADLSGVDLREANLSGVDLSGVDLREADLSGANLRGANLCRADLRGANLSGACFHHCKGVMSFTGEKDLLVYFKTGGEYYFKIGCITKTAEEWLNEFKEIGTKHKYGDSIDIYGDVIKLFSKYDLLEGKK